MVNLNITDGTKIKIKSWKNLRKNISALKNGALSVNQVNKQVPEIIVGIHKKLCVQFGNEILNDNKYLMF